MFRFVRPLLLRLAREDDSGQQQMIDYLQAENRILRKMLPKRVAVAAAEKRTLVNLAKPLGDKIKDLVSIVSPKTLLRWINEPFIPKSKPQEPKPGRPKTAIDIRELIIRLASENGWGFSKILGELKKLKVQVSRTTVRNILKEEGFDTGPKRGEGTWSDFIHRHAQTLWATDFFSKKVLTMRGLVDVYVLFFIHIGSRRVFATSSSAHPDKAWVVQQARNFTMHLDETGKKASHLILDLDSKFVKEFDEVLESEGLEMKRVGPRKPNLNAYAERFVLEIKSETLDHFIAFSEEHLDHLVSEHVKHHNTHRPHQGVGNVTLQSLDDEPPDVIPLPGVDTSKPAERPDVIPFPSEIACDSRLGGKIRHYYRRPVAA